MAMGTGGASGAAYAGFLHALQARSVHVRAICACGASALPAFLSSCGRDLLLATKVWAHLEAGVLLRDSGAVSEAVATLFRRREPTSAAAEVAVVACDVESGQPVVVAGGQVASACELGLWSLQGPGTAMIEGRLLSDGSPFGVPVRTALELFGKPVVAIRVGGLLPDYRSMAPGLALAQALLLAGAGRLDARPCLSVEIALPRGTSRNDTAYDHALAWFAAGVAAGQEAIPQISTISEKGESGTGEMGNFLE